MFRNVIKYFKIFQRVLLSVLAGILICSCGGGGGGGGGNSGSQTPNAVMSDFLNSLKNNDINGIANKFDPSVREMYKNAFVNAKENNNFNSIYEDFKSLEEIYVRDNIAKYKIRTSENGVVITYYIYLRRNSDGDWNIFSL